MVDKFNKEANLTKHINQYDTCKELEEFLCKFITQLKKLNGENYKAESVYNCYASLARYLKKESIFRPYKIWDQYTFLLAIKILDGKMKQLQIQGLEETVQADSLTKQELKQILDHSSMNGGDTYKIEDRQITRRNDCGLNLEIFIEKNNQMVNIYRPIYDILKYKSMRSSNACSSFFLETIRSKK
ncbi:13906_t:CDS:2, partial [Funneliformis geosporum]